MILWLDIWHLTSVIKDINTDLFVIHAVLQTFDKTTQFKDQRRLYCVQIHVQTTLKVLCLVDRLILIERLDKKFKTAIF